MTAPGAVAEFREGVIQLGFLDLEVFILPEVRGVALCTICCIGIVGKISGGFRFAAPVLAAITTSAICDRVVCYHDLVRNNLVLAGVDHDIFDFHYGAGRYIANRETE